MDWMIILIRWGCVLGLALLAPVSLPAGGMTPFGKQQLIRRRELSGPLLAVNSSFLRTGPFINAPTLCELKAGTPLRVIRFWESDDGKAWLHVQISSAKELELSLDVRRGWLNV